MSRSPNLRKRSQWLEPTSANGESEFLPREMCGTPRVKRWAWLASGGTPTSELRPSRSLRACHTYWVADKARLKNQGRPVGTIVVI